jgi:hypothetical protein
LGKQSFLKGENMQTSGISTNKYGTTGLPKFGQNYIDVARSGQITELDGAFNQFMSAVKGLTAPGNEIALAKFAAGLENLYWQGIQCVAGKPVVNS